VTVPTISVGKGETAVVGYGLLLVRRTVDRTVGGTYGGPFARCRLDGWRRVWGATMPNEAFYYDSDGGRVYPQQITYLDIVRHSGTALNCVVIVLNDIQLAAMNAREWIYEATPVARSLQGVRIDGGEALAYTASSDHRRDPAAQLPEVAIRRTYLDGLDGMLEGLGPDQRSQFLATTEEPPERLIVDDALDPDRPNPWEAAGQSFDPSRQTDE